MPGALLAVPPFYADKLRPAIQTTIGRKLLTVLTDFGGYLDDNTAHGAGAFNVEGGVVEEGAAAYDGLDLRSVRPNAPLYRDLLAVFQRLHVVDNNAEEHKGGGGAPRRSPAPPICGEVPAASTVMPSALADCGSDPMNALPDALAALRGARAGSTATRATLKVRGVCRVAAPLILGAEDGNADWVGVGEHTAISGGIELATGSWSEHARAECAGCGSVWVAALNASFEDARQLYVDGVRANRTVMPFPQATATKHALGFDSPLARNFSHNRGAQIEMLHRGTHSCNYSCNVQWAETRTPVRLIEGDTFVMLQPAYSHSNNNGNLLPCFLENAFELLGDAVHGRPGDFFYDAEAGAIYVVGLVPPRRAILPQSKGLLVANNISDWTVSGLALQDATWLLDESGFTQAQAGTYVRGPQCGSFNASAPSGKNTSEPCPGRRFDQWSILPAAVHVHAGRRVSFVNCSFRRLGATGVAFDRGSQNCSVARSVVEDVSGNGIQIGTIDSYNISDPTQQDAGNAVIDSVVRSVGREWLGTCGIIAFYSRRTRVLHNEVSHVPYTGISIGWGWNQAMEITWPNMPWDRDNVVDSNHVHHIDGVMGDGGAIYTLGVQGNRPFRQGNLRPSYPALPLAPLQILPMSLITKNWIHDNGWPSRPGHGVRPGDGTPAGDGSHGPGGIYLDNGSTGWNCTGNVFQSITVWALACYTTGIDNNSFTNNTAVCSDWCGPLGPKVRDCVVEDNVQVATAAGLSAADRDVVERAGPRPLPAESF